MPRIEVAVASIALVASLSFGSSVVGSNGDDWISMFNGENLNGWTVKIKGSEVGDNYGDTFRAEDGILKVAYDKYTGPYRGRFGHLFYNELFSQYVMRFEYRFVGEQTQGAPGWAIRNSGVMIHGQSPESMEKDQNFPVSLEVQLLGGGGRKLRPTGNLCTPGTNVFLNGVLEKQHCNNSSSDTYHGEQWVPVEIEVHGERLIKHKIDGRTVIEYSQPQLDPTDPDAQRLLAAGAEKMLTGGTISLQSEGHPVHFRKLQIRRLQD